ncbi:MAG: DUF2062 domain-containing protein [Lentisphaeria bacterium]|nr:DUF2062 domain-containing protein [Lentisphaeria bacterium]NQZ66496.1 DUF2062 domain-containing protein [Lentisphaeria bacterium]
MFKRPLRYYYLKIMRQKGSPHQVAVGVSIGVCVGLIVPPGGQILILIAILPFIKCNKLLPIVGCTISNPITFGPLYAFYFWLGKLVTGLEASFKKPDVNMSTWEWLSELWQKGGDILIILLVGGLICTFVGTITCYYITKAMVTSFRGRKVNKQLNRMDDINRKLADEANRIRENSDHDS